MAEAARVVPSVLRPRDVAERWDCSERFVRNMLARGR